MEKVKVAVLGATGYSALELLKLLLRHPHVEITTLTSRQEERPHIAEIHPSLTGRLDLQCEPLEPVQLVDRAEVVFGCLPHGVTSQVVPELLDRGVKFIDFSADYRLHDPEVFATWYGQKHGDPDRLKEAVYGLPELFRSAIPSARLIANPGCYPTTATLPLAPLVKAKLIEPGTIIVDAKSGVSGAGRALKLNTLFCEANEGLSAYNIGKHRHTPEMEQILLDAGEQQMEIIFTPHLIPMDRGILATSYSTPASGVTEQDLLQCLKDFYQDEPFMEVVDHLPSTKEVAHTNRCHMTTRLVRGKVLTISVLDNLIKGAAGAAVQNFNLLCNFEETTALF
ncbi:N-acetyl-gamma-glutamyl-phosphate reductase [Planctomycetales bacterium 10988]|nr:N-acetyl-gamma-glutamyl-phosphate reductase [Planctomycetales bacterium 10988]